VWNVSVPQAIGWSQVEISLAIILACAPMSAKLLIHPLDTEQYLVGMETTCLSHVDTETSIDKITEASSVDQSRLASVPKVYTMGGVEMISGGDVVPISTRACANQTSGDGPQERLSVVTQGLGGVVVLGEWATPREIQSPDYHKFRVVRAEVDGRMVWVVRPVSPTTPV